MNTMKHVPFSRSPYICIALLVLIPLLASEPAKTVSSQIPDQTTLSPVTYPARLDLDPSADRQIIIELSDPSVVEAMIAEQVRPADSYAKQWAPEEPLNLTSPRAAALRSRIQT